MTPFSFWNLRISAYSPILSHSIHKNNPHDCCRSILTFALQWTNTPLRWAFLWRITCQCSANSLVVGLVWRFVFCFYWMQMPNKMYCHNILPPKSDNLYCEQSNLNVSRHAKKLQLYFKLGVRFFHRFRRPETAKFEWFNLFIYWFFFFLYFMMKGVNV